MAWIVVLIMVAWPVTEFTAFAQVARWVGTPSAILGLFLSAALGFAILRGQSISSAARMRTLLNQGRIPVRDLFDSAAVAFASLLLIVPGYVTDAIGLLLLLPFVRRLIYDELSVLVRTSEKGRAQARREAAERGVSAVIDAEYTVLDHDDDNGNGGGGSGGRPSIRLLL